MLSYTGGQLQMSKSYKIKNTRLQQFKNVCKNIRLHLTFFSHAKILEGECPKKRKFQNTKIIDPCFFAEGVDIKNSIIGPFVSVGANSSIESSNIKNTIIQSNSKINGANFNGSIIGSFVDYNQNAEKLNIGDYCTFK